MGTGHQYSVVYSNLYKGIRSFVLVACAPLFSDTSCTGSYVVSMSCGKRSRKGSFYAWQKTSF